MKTDNLNSLTFEYLKPFRSNSGNTIRMKALITMHGIQYVEDEASISHLATELTPLTPEEYQEHMDKNLIS